VRRNGEGPEEHVSRGTVEDLKKKKKKHKKKQEKKERKEKGQGGRGGIRSLLEKWRKTKTLERARPCHKVCRKLISVGRGGQWREGGESRQGEKRTEDLGKFR